MRKITKKGLKRKLDIAWRGYVYKRDKYRCQMCGRSKKQGFVLNAHHIVTKGSSGLAGRWDVDNGITLCFRCHQVDYIALADFCKKFLAQKGIDYEDHKNKYKGAVYKPALEDLLIKLQVLEQMKEER